jgi:hypothetical protein
MACAPCAAARAAAAKNAKAGNLKEAASVVAAGAAAMVGIISKEELSRRVDAISPPSTEPQPNPTMASNVKRYAPPAE